MCIAEFLCVQYSFKKTLLTRRRLIDILYCTSADSLNELLSHIHMDFSFCLSLLAPIARTMAMVTDRQIQLLACNLQSIRQIKRMKARNLKNSAALSQFLSVKLYCTYVHLVLR